MVVACRHGWLVRKEVFILANHIQQLQIETFRGIKELTIDNLGVVNILVGDNNTGKTTVLEAIQLLCNPSRFNLIKSAIQREKY